MFHEQDRVLTSQESTEFVESWQYIWNILKEYGATNVSWIWSPSYYSYQGYSALYPGDSYVDWTGMAGYTDGKTTFNQMFSVLYNANLKIAPTKPVMIVEVGCYESAYKAEWFTDMLSTQLPNNYGQVKAICYWEGPVGGRGSPRALLVESDTNALNAFRQGIALSYYSSNVCGFLNISPITAIGETSNSMPTRTPSSYPTSTPTHSPTAFSSFGASEISIIVVVAVIAFVAVVPKSRARLFRIMGRFVHHK